MSLMWNNFVTVGRRQEAVLCMRSVSSYIIIIAAGAIIKLATNSLLCIASYIHMH